MKRLAKTASIVCLIALILLTGCVSSAGNPAKSGKTSVAKQTTTKEIEELQTTIEKTEVPTTEAVTTEVPTTEAPTTEAPTTAKQTEAPTTVAETPAPTSPPTVAQTEAPVANNNMVWVPTNGGTKYHKNATCSGMIDPRNVTMDEAINEGFTACKKCYR